MSLELWGAIAASFLLLQCVLFNLIWVALALVFWKGAEWVRSHTGLALAKVWEWMVLGRGYVQRGEQYVAGPFVRLRGRIEGARAIMARLKG